MQEGGKMREENAARRRRQRDGEGSEKKKEELNGEGRDAKGGNRTRTYACACRHHCRKCGESFCASCASREIKMPELGVCAR